MTQSNDSPVLAAMKRLGAPLTREEFLCWYFSGEVPETIDPEIEAEFPVQFQRATLMDTPPASERKQ
jgi:hypothetical protein